MSLTATMPAVDRRRASERRYPFDPIAQALGVDNSAAARHLHISGTTWQQYRDHGLTAVVADRLAVRIGHHPAELWPDWPTDTDPLTRPGPIPQEPAERPDRWHVELTCPHCGANTRPVTVGKPTDAGTRITAVLECAGRRRHRLQLTATLHPA